MRADVLRDELAFFAEQKPALLAKYPGQFALIKKRTLVGVYPTQEDAYTEGFRRFGKESFLVKQIVEHEGTEQLPLLASYLQRADL